MSQLYAEDDNYYIFLMTCIILLSTLIVTRFVLSAKSVKYKPMIAEANKAKYTNDMLKSLENMGFDGRREATVRIRPTTLPTRSLAWVRGPRLSLPPDFDTAWFRYTSLLNRRLLVRA